MTARKAKEPRVPVASPRVSFLIAGAQKCGTTALDAYLRQHPGIEMAREKETHFFDQEGGFDWRRPDYSGLHGQYSGSPTRVRGEATPITLYWTPAHYRVLTYNPDMRFVLIFRDPVERAYSHWKMTKSRGLEPLSFSEAIRSGRVRILNDPEQSGLNRRQSYVERGFYGRQLSSLLALFPLENMLFLRQQDLVENRLDCLNTIYDFLSVEPASNVDARSLNVGPAGLEPMALEDRAFLQDLYRDDIALFKSITSLNL